MKVLITKIDSRKIYTRIYEDRFGIRIQYYIPKKGTELTVRYGKWDTAAKCTGIYSTRDNRYYVVGILLTPNWYHADNVWNYNYMLDDWNISVMAFNEFITIK